MNKVWKDVVGFEDRYSICEDGTLMSKPYIKRTRNRNGLVEFLTKPRVLKTYKNNEGYIQISLSGSGGKKKLCKLHRILAEAFIPNPKNKSQVNHINGIKDDNRLENLEWCTAKENVKHSYEAGLACNKGERHPRARFTNDQVRRIRELRKGGLPLKIIGDMFGVKESTISKITTGVNYAEI